MMLGRFTKHFLEQFSNSFALRSLVLSGSYFQPSNNDLSLGAPAKIETTQRIGFLDLAIEEPS
jgi:hypothetical protein